MAKGSAAPGAAAPDTNTINLGRLLARLEKTLLDPDLATERRLRASGDERRKVGANLDHARTLLRTLELDAAAAKGPARRLELLQADLLRKRGAVQALAERLREFDALGDDADDGSSDGEDLLAQDTPSDDLDDAHDTPPEPPEPLAAHADRPADADAARESLFSSTLRARRTDAAASASTATAAATATTTALAETMLTHNRTEQESLTTSLLAMAQALKTSSQAMTSALDVDNDVLARATHGLDRNKGSLEVAQKKMGYLRTLTEGRGWWGRVLMYVWIAVLMLVALFIVGFLPKLRF